MHRIESFGGVRILDPSGQELHFRSRKHVALLVYLRSNWRRVHLREPLSRLFWDSETSLARHSLSQALYDLRSSLGQVILNCPGDSLRIETERVAFDAQELEEAVNADRLEDALTIYRAPFAPELEQVGSDDFERWLEEERGRLQILAQAALRRFLDQADERGHWGKMCTAALRLVEMNPLDEGAHRALMRALWLHGDQRSALDHFEQVRTLFLSKLPNGLSSDTCELVERIRGSRPRPSSEAPSKHNHMPMVGREDEVERLRHFIDARNDSPSILVLAGEAGVGKTRLVEELEKVATLGGYQILRSCCYAAESEVAYGPILDGLTEVVGNIAGLNEEERPAYLEIGSLFPALAGDPGSQSTTGDPPSIRRRLFEEVTDVVRRYCGDRSVLWIIEDLHWVDSASSALLHYLLRRLGTGGLRIVMTTRPEGDRSEAACRLLDDEYMSDLAAFLGVAPLTREATILLLRSASRIELEEEVTNRIVTLSGGNPFYALEILSAVGSGDVVEDLGVDEILTGKLRTVLATRLRGLNASAIRLLEALSVVDPYGKPIYVAECAGLSLEEAAEECHELYARRLVQDDGERIAFAHDITRDFVYETLGLVTRAALHLRAGEVLASDSSISLAAIARHFRKGDDRARAYEYGIRAAHEAVDSAAHQEAINMGQMAAAAAISEESELNALRIIADSEWALGNLEKAVEHYQVILTRTNSGENTDCPRIQLRLAELLITNSRWADAGCLLEDIIEGSSAVLGASERIEVLADALRLKTAISIWCKNEEALRVDKARLGKLISQAEHEGCLTAKSQILATHALATYSAFYDSARTAQEMLAGVEQGATNTLPHIQQRTLLLRSAVEQRLGNWDAARHFIMRVLDLSSATRDLFVSAKAHNNLGCIAMGRGRWLEARNCFEDAMALCEHLPGSATPLFVSRLNLAKISFFEGKPRDAIQSYRKLLRVLAEKEGMLGYFETELRAGMALASIQTGDSSVFVRQWERLESCDESTLRGVQERYLLDWLSAYVRKRDGTRGGEASLRKRSTLEASIDSVASLKLAWLAQLLFPDGKRKKRSAVMGRLREAELYWFARFSRRWLRSAEAQNVEWKATKMMSTNREQEKSLITQS